MVLAYPSSFHFEEGRVPKEFAPTCHIFYGEAIIEVDDGVPKWSGHKDESKLLPHAVGKRGALGHGTTGRESRGEQVSGQGQQPLTKSERPKRRRHDSEAIEKHSIEHPGTGNSARAPTK